MDLLTCVSGILKDEAEAISNIVVNGAFEQAIEELLACKGKIVTTGIGKAGLVAQKFAATLCSTATPAVFLHPVEAVHGNIGLIRGEDCMVAFSTSGKSTEVINVLKQSRFLNIKTIIGVTSHFDTDFRLLSDVIIEMGNIKEPCPLGLTPTASTVVMLAISDALALGLMKLKMINQADFALRHSAGYLGKKSKNSS